MTTAHAPIAALVKSATVPQDPTAAFRLFTEDFGAWWPLMTHSVGLQDATGVTFGRAVGEQIVETVRTGDRATWGTITAWAPPERVSFTWHPGEPEEEATSVEVTFVVAGAGTQVTLTHTDWENRPDAREARHAYDTGWDIVFGRYAELASR